MTEEPRYNEKPSYENPLDDEMTLDKLISTAKDLGGLKEIPRS